jgi:hypothetical protein
MYEVYKNAYLIREKSDYDFAYKPDLVTVKIMLNDAKFFIKILLINYNKSCLELLS